MEITTKKAYILTGMIITLAIALLLYRDNKSIEEHVLLLAKQEATAAFNKDLSYRKWASLHGGVYVPIDSSTPPNPFLSHIKERDIVTSSGRKLTLINPAYMTRQVHELTDLLYGNKGHITSLKPLRLQNKPDDWETTALENFKSAFDEYYDIQFIDTVQYFRFMKPLIAEKPCLKCHEVQGYKEGDLRGGISISVPWQPYDEIVTTNKKEHLVMYSSILFVFFIGLVITYLSTDKSRRKQKIAEDLLKLTQYSIDNIDDFVIWLDLSGRINLVNNFAIEKLEYLSNEIKFVTIFDLDGAMTKEDWTAGLEGINQSKPWITETIFRTKDGHEIQVDVKYHHIIFGNESYICMVARDISQRKAAESALIISERKFRSYVDNAPHGIIVNGNDLSFISVNYEVCRLSGYDIETLRTMKIEDLLPDDSKNTLTNHFENLQSNYRADGQYAFKRNNGEIIYWNISSIRIDESTLLSFVVDVTKQKNIMEELSSGREILESLFNAIHESVCLMNSEGNLITCNKTFASRLNLRTKDVIGRNIYNLIPLELARQRRKLVDEVLKTGESIVFEDERQGFWFSNSVWPVKHSDGKIDSVVIYASNITLKKTAEELLKKQNKELEVQYEEYMQLNEELRQTNFDLEIAKSKAEESDNLKTAFLQNMSHEIRTPLNGIIGFTNLLKEEGLTNEEYVEFTNMISKSSNRLLELVNNIMDVSLIETEQIEIVSQNVNIHSLLEDLYLFFKHQTLERKIELNYVWNFSNDFLIISDETKLNQILTNLIYNAIKFTHSGSISYGCELKGSSLLFFVKDTGIGIAEEYIQLIFDRFRQVDLSLTRGFEGAGLGLAICKGFVEKLGGRIWVESEVGKGSTFYFTLPRISE